MTWRMIVTEAPPETLLTLEDELDIAAGTDLRFAVHEALEGGAHTIVIDLAGVTFLDSAGLWSLIFCRNLAEAASCTLTVTGHSAAVDRLLRILDRDWITQLLWPDYVRE